MNYSLSVDKYGMTICTPEGSDTSFRAYCPDEYQPMSDNTYVQVRVQVVEPGQMYVPIGWYNADLFEQINLSYKGSGGDVQSSEELTHPRYADDSVWSLGLPSKDWVLTRFDNSGRMEMLSIPMFGHYREMILDMCRAQACKQTAKRIFHDVRSTGLLPVKHR